GLILFVLRDMNKEVVWKNGILKFTFWSLNIGLITMVLLSILPVGIAQTVESVNNGLWSARSAEFLQQDYLVTFKWLRTIGDVIFACGCVTLAWFILGLKFGWSLEKKSS
ncbi:MAG: nitric-oxide reductase large subunit, partial [Bacteroidales bacterium]